MPRVIKIHVLSKRGDRLHQRERKIAPDTKVPHRHAWKEFIIKEANLTQYRTPVFVTFGSYGFLHGRV